MNLKNEDYRPADISFDVATDGSPMPERMGGGFEKHEDVLKFLSDSKLTTINQAITASRHMDFIEKKELREQYNDILENILPRYEKEYTVCLSELNEAKRKEKDASEMVSATISEVKILSKEVKRGVKDIRLDDLYTFRIPYKGRYYFYTWIDKQLKLCRITDIPEHEKTEIWNAMAYNEEFIDNHFSEASVETSA
jgi:hypothetical protein